MGPAITTPLIESVTSISFAYGSFGTRATMFYTKTAFLFHLFTTFHLAFEHARMSCAFAFNERKIFTGTYATKLVNVIWIFETFSNNNCPNLVCFEFSFQKFNFMVKTQSITIT
jgi:hypothetical protein